MLNFSKINIFLFIYYFSDRNFFFLNLQPQDNEIINKKVNLGLDLQGGSYLLLEIKSDLL